MTETWKVVVNSNDKYEVSNTGKVRRKETGRILTPSLNFCGYEYVTICFSGKHKQIRVHRAVAEAFIPNPENKPEVNHIDGDKLNNCVENLEWCTRLENEQHAWKTGLKKRRYGFEHKNSKEVVQLTLDNEYIKRWASASEVEKVLGYNQANISECCRHKRNFANGYMWRYAKEYDADNTNQDELRKLEIKIKQYEKELEDMKIKKEYLQAKYLS